jgi:hypothetical protein
LDKTLVACETIEDEVKAALADSGLALPVVWLEGGLHNNPDRLRARVQEILDSVRCQRLIICLGYCGGGLSGLFTRSYQTVLPLADDCLSLMLGSMEARRLASKPVTYFLTAGWLRHENSLVTSYDQAVEKYGQRQAERINKLLLRHYHRIGLVRTGCYDLCQTAERVRPLADLIGLTVEHLPGDLDWLKTLLTGPYDDPSRYLVVGPDSAITFDQWCPLLMGGDPAAAPGPPQALDQITAAP